MIHIAYFIRHTLEKPVFENKNDILVSETNKKTP